MKLNTDYFYCPLAPLSIAIMLTIVMMPHALAANLQPGQSAEVNIGDLPERWILTNATLTVNSNGQTNSIRSNAGSRITINNGSVSDTNRAFEMFNSTATITGSTITSTGNVGLVVDRNADYANPPSNATVLDSTITGVGFGALVASDSILSLSNSHVTGTGGAGTGIASLGGIVTLQNQSTVTGDVNGMRLSNTPPNPLAPNPTDTTLLVDNSTITGGSGSAILASSETNTPTNANIRIANGSILNGGNGLSLEVSRSTNVALAADGSTLNGGILVSDDSTANVQLNNNSRLTGDVTNVKSLDLNNGSSMTGNLTRSTDLTLSNNSSITGNVSNVENFTLNNGSSLSGNLSDSVNVSADNGSRLKGAIANVEQLNVANNSSITGNLSNVANLNLDNSTWTTIGGSEVGNLSLNSATVKLGEGDGTFEKLTVGTLAGNGRFVMDTDLASHQSDLLDVTGKASGNHELLIKNTGVDPIKGDQDQQVVHTGSGSDASFAVVGGQVDFGTFAYDLEQRGTDWFLVQKYDDDGTPIITPGTESVIGLFSAAPTVWYGELTSLRSRMGELRYGKTEGGAWARAYGNKYNMSAAGGTAYQQNQSGISYGADLPLPTASGQWLIGVLGGYSRSDLDIAAGTTGRVDSYYLGAYSTWLSDSGYYVDAILKANRFKNKSDVRMSDGTKSDGDYTSHGIGASVEAGKHIKLQDDWFVEPFVQASSLWVSGENYSLDNGMEASSNKADSLLGKVGTSVGRNFALDKGGFVQPYVKVAMAHEFSKSNRVKVNSTTFSNDLSGSRGEVGAGIAAQLSDVLQLHADIDYSKGKNIEQPWGVNVGVRYSW